MRKPWTDLSLGASAELAGLRQTVVWDRAEGLAGDYSLVGKQALL